MTRLIDADALKLSHCKECSLYPDKCMGKDCDWYAIIHINEMPTIDAVPLDGSFLKMSKGDYLIYNRHWLYEHFDQEMDIQRSAMKSMGYEPALKDTEPHWIPCSERLPEDGVYLVYAPEYRGGSSRSKECHEGLLFSVCKNGKWSIEHGYYSRPNCVIAWMPLPKPFKVYKMR